MGDKERRSTWQGGGSKAAKQQKRKTKVAISVRVLHNLQDQAHISNAFLFYQDLEKEIEHAIAAKLECFRNPDQLLTI